MEGVFYSDDRCEDASNLLGFQHNTNVTDKSVPSEILPSRPRLQFQSRRDFSLHFVVVWAIGPMTTLRILVADYLAGWLACRCWCGWRLLQDVGTTLRWFRVRLLPQTKLSLTRFHLHAFVHRPKLWRNVVFILSVVPSQTSAHRLVRFCSCQDSPAWRF